MVIVGFEECLWKKARSVKPVAASACSVHWNDTPSDRRITWHLEKKAELLLA
jgi:hypothetical protein